MKKLQNCCQPQIYCVKGNVSHHACFNKQCDGFAFVCQITEGKCICRSLHRNCLMIQTSTILQNFKAKILSSQPIIQKIQTIIDQTIDCLSNWRDNVIAHIKENFEQLGLNQMQKQFIEGLKIGKVQSITGNIIWNNIISVSQSKVQSQYNLSKDKIFNTLDLFKLTTEKHIEKLDKAIKKHNIFKSDSKQTISKFFEFQNSSIIKTNDEVDKINEFLKPFQVQNFSLLYKASDNEFQISKFRQKCCGIPHTLVICETRTGKIFGGYTPVAWVNKSWQLVGDESGRSFIFSLSNNDKFELVNKKEAIVQRNDYSCGPQFGSSKGYDLLICNNASTEPKSFTNINSGYMNKRYNNKDKDSIGRFNGNYESQFFYLKEWQVWQINFEN